MMKLKKSIFLFFSFCFMFLFIYTQNIFAFDYNEFKQYHNLGYNIMKINYDNYHDLKQKEKYQKSKEFKELQNIVKVDNIFDIASKDLEKKILAKKIRLLNTIKNDEIKKTGQSEIDDEIINLEKEGKYLVLTLPGQLITITDNNFLYLYKHKITGNVNLVKQVKNVFTKYKGKDKEIKDTYGFKTELIEIFDKYGLKYKEINGYGIPVNIYIGKNNDKKSMQTKTFFISKGFSTPELEQYLEGGGKRKVYLWKYLTNDDVKYDFNIRESQKYRSEIIVNVPLFNQNIFMGMLSEKARILQAPLFGSNVDLFIYQINKNYYEYLIAIVIFVLGILLGSFLLMNFLTNYRNNFKKIPEEL